MLREVILPTLGLDMEEAVVEKWLKREGDSIARDEPILIVETEKASTEINSPFAGVVKQLLFPEGATVLVTRTVALVETAEPVGATAPAPLPVADGTAPAAEVSNGKVVAGNGAGAAPAGTTVLAPERPEAGRVRASPAARRVARELGVDLSQVKGTGPRGRVQGDDVRRLVEESRRAPEGLKVSPVAQRLAQERGVDLAGVVGTGPGGRITKEDVLAAAEGAARVPAAEVARPVVPEAPRPAAPEAPRPAAPGLEAPATVGGLPGRLVPLGRKRRVTAERMAASARAVARVTENMDVDASELIALRNRLLPLYQERFGAKPSYDALLARVVAFALAEHPYLNARWTDNGIYLVEPVNVGVAMAVEDGLIVPVIRNADRKRLAEISVELNGLVARAREDRLTLDDLTGGTFTITNLGMFGVDSFTPIVNPPEAAILGVGRIVERPVGRDGQIVLRPMMTLSLSFDHRIVDGAPAALFLQRVAQLLEEPRLLI